MDYRNSVVRNINYPDETIIGVKVIEKANYNDREVIERSKIKIYATQSANDSSLKMPDFLHAFDLICFEEYLIFINRHIFNDDLELPMARAKSIYDIIKVCNF